MTHFFQEEEDDFECKLNCFVKVIQINETCFEDNHLAFQFQVKIYTFEFEIIYF